MCQLVSDYNTDQGTTLIHSNLYNGSDAGNNSLHHSLAP